MVRQIRPLPAVPPMVDSVDIVNLRSNIKDLHDWIVRARDMWSDVLLPDQRGQDATLLTKVDTTTQVIAGTALTGGGALSGDVTLNVDTATLQAAFTAVDSVTAGTGPAVGVNPQTANFIHVSVVANVGDCITMPASSAGAYHLVANDGANSMDIYPASGGAINAGATDAAAALAAGGRAYFVYQTTNKWRMVTVT